MCHLQLRSPSHWCKKEGDDALGCLSSKRTLMAPFSAVLFPRGWNVLKVGPPWEGNGDGAKVLLVSREVGAVSADVVKRGSSPSFIWSMLPPPRRRGGAEAALKVANRGLKPAWRVDASTAEARRLARKVKHFTAGVGAARRGSMLGAPVSHLRASIRRYRQYRARTLKSD